MSGRRPLFRSPKFAEGMTSDAIEESGEKVCMFAIGRGNGAGRRFESVPEDANEPIDISILKPGRTTAITLFQKICQSLFSEGDLRAIGYPPRNEHSGGVCAGSIT